jgi:hypothetical protein
MDDVNVIVPAVQKNVSKEEGQCLISFIIPVYNTKLYVRETLDSVATHGGGEVEIIVVDDGSTDGGIAEVEAWILERDVPVRIISQQNAGLSAARMAGVAVARGTFIGFCDSDDRIDAATYMTMARLAEARGCDIAICRSVVFDSVTGLAHDFYDAWLWDRILAGRQSVILNGAAEPQLFRLEPNANTKLLRRSFMAEHALEFPKGLLFEDFPVHVHGLAVAAQVLLLDATGYFYRVNRTGKITDQKSAKRFDMLKSAELAFTYAENEPAIIQAQVLAIACRMLYWCGANTLNHDRLRFYTEAAALLRGKVQAQAWREVGKAAVDEREMLMIAGFAAGATAFLLDAAAHKRPSPFAVLPVLLNPALGARVRRLALRVARHRVGALTRRIMRLGR